MNIEHAVNCGNIQNGQSAAKPRNRKVQRLEETRRIKRSEAQRTPFWGDDIVSSSQECEAVNMTAQEVANLGEDNAVKEEQLHGTRLYKSVFTSEGVSNNSVNCWESRNCQSAAKPSGEGSTTIPFWEYSQAAGSAEQPTGLVI